MRRAHTPGACRDRMCGAYDCSMCRGEGAWVYYMRCDDCDEMFEDCDCDEFKQPEED